MDSDMKLPWRSAALGCLVIAVSCVAALAVIASLKNADVLATVALALAVLAFAAQLVIAIAQGQSANQQLLQSERVNTETQRLLSEIRSGSNELTLTVRQQFDFVLRHALGSAVPRAVKEAGLDSLQPNEIHRLESALGASFAVPGLGYSIAPSSASEALDYLQTIPTEQEVGNAPEIVLSLTPLEVIALQKIAQSEVRQLRLGTPVGVSIGESAVGSRALIKRGLIAEIPSPNSNDNRTWVRLTQGGREIARLILVDGIPPWLAARWAGESKK
jgi:hypothetical protein